MTIWAIDADEALIGHVGEFARLGAAVPDPRIHALHFPAAALRADALMVAKVAAGLPLAVLCQIVEASCTVARDSGGEELSEALARRCAQATTLTEHYLARLELR